jgi:hypothetical protein
MRKNIYYVDLQQGNGFKWAKKKVSKRHCDVQLTLAIIR